MISLPANYKLEKADILTEDMKRTFLSPTSIRAVLIKPGDILYRFMSKDNGYIFSPYWITDKTFISFFDIFHSWEHPSDDTKRNVIKAQLAVLNDWNDINYRLKLSFSKEMVGYIGQTSPQKNFKKDEKNSKAIEFRIGGFEQIVIPCLSNIKLQSGMKMVQEKSVTKLF